MEISHLQEHDGVAVKILALNVKLVSFSIKIENRLKNVFGSVFNENAYETFFKKEVFIVSGNRKLKTQTTS